MSDYHGSMRMADGSRVSLTEEEAKELWQVVKQAGKDRAERLPDAKACLTALSSAKDRMRELGWRDSRYCPRDGSTFAVCEIGSTGMWSAFYHEPYIHYADCVSTQGPHVFFKAMDKLTDEERATLVRGDKTVSDDIARMGEMFR
ncbi:hypothetical protein E5S70_17610 [Ensifer adhaerens]|uniref:hypothetical protein n=1 Tax=Ensifer canadensis TaxID=555315 RepID=UPI0014903449|nr:hypothetical protein [Ensifer canadensis]NOV17871.1 hypothetical protein [Ensifer canadensis]